MKLTSKKILAITAASALTISLDSGAWAAQGMNSMGPGQDGMMHGPGGMQGMQGQGMQGHQGGRMQGDPMAMAEQRMSRMKNTLGISAEQEPAWKNFSDAMKQKAALMRAHRATMGGSTPISGEQRFAMRQQGLQQMQKTNTAASELYKSLTPEQRARADQMMGQRFRR
ncbi:MAG: Spy/CpxP family protein refolding chaperone [gamma proteobacterium symbiont of Bathyaustriella thionipta]|nr:Spy/CpxP family protein refolding chaperone [gamma proteobacterium symbiont of Bathyaustriella thionipta]